VTLFLKRQPDIISPCIGVLNRNRTEEGSRGEREREREREK
jgi:hypothetical protein